MKFKIYYWVDNIRFDWFGTILDLIHKNGTFIFNGEIRHDIFPNYDEINEVVKSVLSGYAYQEETHE